MANAQRAAANDEKKPDLPPARKNLQARWRRSERLAQFRREGRCVQHHDP